MFDIKNYIEATTLEEAIKIATSDSTVRFVAGGTDVFVNSRARNKDLVGAVLVGITKIPELGRISILDDGTLSIGASSTFTQIETNEYAKKCVPILCQAAALVGGAQTRNIGTIGGNVCNGATSGDSGATLFAYNASLELHGPNGIRKLPIEDFYKGPGWVDLEQGEILVKILIKKEDYHGFGGGYQKFAQRKAMDIANLSCTTLFKEKDGIITDLRIAYGVAGPTPIRAKTAEKFGIGKALNDKNLDLIGKACLKDTNTRDSWRASKEYREKLVEILPKRNILSWQERK